MSAFIIRRGSVPNAPEVYSVTLTGDPSGPCQIKIDGTYYNSAQTIWVTEGTEITCRAYNYPNATRTITADGKPAGVFSSNWWEFTFTVSHNTTITCLWDDNAMGQIIIS